MAGILHFGRDAGNHNLLRFSASVNVRPLNSSLYRNQKRVAARRGVHTENSVLRKETSLP